MHEFINKVNLQTNMDYLNYSYRTNKDDIDQ